MPEIHMTCPGCDRQLKITTTPWSEDVQAEAEVERLKADNAALRGALGYPVKGEYDNRLSDGTIPMCGLCDAKERERDEARAEVERLKRQVEQWHSIAEHTRKERDKAERERDEARAEVERLTKKVDKEIWLSKQLERERDEAQRQEREAVNRVVRLMFNDYYVEYMGSDLDWLTEFQARLDEEKKRDGKGE